VVDDIGIVVVTLVVVVAAAALANLFWVRSSWMVGIEPATVLESGAIDQKKEIGGGRCFEAVIAAQTWVE